MEANFPAADDQVSARMRPWGPPLQRRSSCVARGGAELLLDADELVEDIGHGPPFSFRVERRSIGRESIMQERRNARTAVPHPEPARPSTPLSGARDEGAESKDEATHRAKMLVQTADVRIVEYTLKPGDGNPWHYHSEVSDRVYCLEGLIGVSIQQPTKSLVLRPGESYEIPPSTVHYVGNAGDGTSRYLLIQALGTYDFIRTD
jgi:quercetin dioxygenase-like cupin family protein